MRWTVFILALLLVAAPSSAVPAPAPTPAAGLSPLQQKYMTEKARLDKMERLAYTTNPELKRVEGAALALNARLKERQRDQRAAIDQYLKEHKLTAKDLPRFKLEQVADLLMKIMPYEIVTNPELKPLVVATIRLGRPVFPAEFEKRFPGKRPNQVPPDQLLAFYETQLRAEAVRSQKTLATLIKEASVPESMLQGQRELTRMRCNLVVLREYLRVHTSPELTAQRLGVRHLELQLRGVLTPGRRSR